MMTRKKLALELCKVEGLKKQVNIAQMSEILGNLADLQIASEGQVGVLLTVYGLERQAKAAKKKKGKK